MTGLDELIAKLKKRIKQHSKPRGLLGWSALNECNDICQIAKDIRDRRKASGEDEEGKS